MLVKGKLVCAANVGFVLLLQAEPVQTSQDWLMSEFSLNCT